MEQGHICNKYCAFGRLGNEIIVFHYGTGSFIYTNVLETIENGIITDYIDEDGDLRPDLIRVDGGETITVYIAGGERLWEAREDFRRYLIRIFKAKQEMRKQMPVKKANF